MELRTYTEKLRMLKPDAQPLWGSMNAHQMIEHLADVMRVSNGKNRMQLAIPQEKSVQAQAFLASEQPMPRNFKAPFIKDGVPLTTPGITEAIDMLERELDHFVKHYEAPGQKEIHPIFGELDHAGWTRLHHKHFTHHLTQFGLIAAQ
jgi:hypothetical protein